MSFRDTSSVTSAGRRGRSPRESSIAEMWSRNPSSLAGLRPASAQRKPLGACRARYSAVRRPVNPVAPNRTRSSSRSDEGAGGDSSAMCPIVPVWEPFGQTGRLMSMTGATLVRRTVATVTVLLAVTTAFVAGLLVSEARSGEKPAYRLAAAGLDSGLPCEQIRKWYVGHGLDRVTAWGWEEPMYRAAIP